MGVMRPISRLLNSSVASGSISNCGWIILKAARRARGLHLAEDGDGLAGLESVLQIGATKPDALQRAGALAQRHLEDRHCSSAQQDGAAYFADDARHLAGDQLMQSPRIGAIFVAEGEVIEQVFRGADVFFGKRLRDARPDSFDELDGSIDREHALMLEHFR